MTSDIIKRVVQIVHQLELVDSESGEEDDTSSSPKTSLMELCQIQDALVDRLQLQAKEGTTSLPQRGSPVDIVHWQLSSLYDDKHKMGPVIIEQIATEADTYRAILGSSMHLLETISTGTKVSKMDNSTIKRLQHTINQSKHLLKILSSIYSLSCGTDDLTAALPSQYPTLQRWIDGLVKRSDTCWAEDETFNIISFDRQDLSLEEDQLILMANTPTPLETGLDEDEVSDKSNTQGDSTLCPPGLVAHISSTHLNRQEASDQPPSVQIIMDHCGLMRLQGRVGSERASWWAALSPSSTTHYEFPTFTITSVVIPTGNKSDLSNRFSLSTIALEVGRDGRLWWEATAKVIRQLKNLQSLWEESENLWPQEQVETQIPSVYNEQSILGHE